MFTNLKIRLEPEEGRKISNQMAPAFHGALMEQIRPEYAQKLHMQTLRPYSQFLEFHGREVFWNVNTLNDEAYRELMPPLLASAGWNEGAAADRSQSKGLGESGSGRCGENGKTNETVDAVKNQLFDQTNSMIVREGGSEDSGENQTIYLKRYGIQFVLGERSLRQVSLEALTARFYEHKSGRYFKIRFMTPTAFKQNGRYTFYPDLRCIYQSLMRKMDFVSRRESFFDEDVLEQIVSDSEISQYHLYSTSFSMEGARIPAFAGVITIRAGGTQTMADYIAMLLRFGEFSGVGIKTSLGMGAMELLEEDKGRTTGKQAAGDYAGRQTGGKRE